MSQVEHKAYALVARSRLINQFHLKPASTAFKPASSVARQSGCKIVAAEAAKKSSPALTG